MSEPTAAEPIQRSRIAIGIHPDLRASLAGLARGRSLVIGYFASARCGSVVGDFSVSWRPGAPDDRYRRLAPIEGVSLYADARLLEVLETSQPELGPGSVLRRGTPRIYLGLPERWLAFLDGPTVLPPGSSRNRS